MDISPVNPVLPRVTQPGVQAGTEPTSATPSAPLPQSAVPPQGMQGRPPIDNIATNPTLNANAVIPNVGQPMNQTAEVVAGSQAMAQKLETEAKDQVQEELSLIDESDEALLADMRDTIKSQTIAVTKKVNRSAFKFMYQKKDWINKEKAAEAEQFFTIKVPKVLAEELSDILNDALGLDGDSGKG